MGFPLRVALAYRLLKHSFTIDVQDAQKKKQNIYQLIQNRWKTIEVPMTHYYRPVAKVIRPDIGQVVKERRTSE